jgi:GNAT superfamily N-acetyltransferase
MEIRTLENTSLAQITTAFNEAFSHYFVPLQFTEEGMAAKIKGEGIQLQYSVGTFEGERLIGFIQHAFDVIDGVKTVYNAGTGVVPDYRGKGITTALYEYAVPLLKGEGICHHLLEVIDKNLSAKKIHEAAGFTLKRKLSVYRSTEPLAKARSVEIKRLTAVPQDKLFVSVRPAWQNSSASIHRDLENHVIAGAYENNSLAGYIVFVPATGRVKQIAVQPAHRRKGIGGALLQHAFQNSKGDSLLVMHVEDGYEPAVRFLEALKFQPIIGLYEMTLQVIE